MNPEYNFKEDFLLDPDIIFLNHGSFGATPRPVFEVYQRWQLELERQPVAFLGRKVPELLRSAREPLADFLHVKPTSLAFITNTTIGINTIARSLRLGPGNLVLTTNHEYGAMDKTWEYLANKNGFTYRKMRIRLPIESSEQFLEDLTNGLEQKPDVLFISHIPSPTAQIFPIESAIKYARKNGILTIIDGAHAPGQIPLDLSKLGADFYVGNLHKWLCAPKGSAFLFASTDVLELLDPLVISWGYSPTDTTPDRLANFIEWQGTRDISAFLAVPAAIQYQQNHNWDEVRQQCHRLTAATIQEISDFTGLPALYAQPDVDFAQMASIRLPESSDLESLKTSLYETYKIEVPLIAWESEKLLRISVQCYNTQADLDRLIQALQKELPVYLRG